MDVTRIDWFSLTPELVLMGAVLLVLVVEPFLPPARKRLCNAIGVLGCLGSLAMVIALAVDGRPRQSFGAMFVVDDYALLFKGLFLGTALLVLLVSWRYFQEIRTYQGEYYFLLLSAFVGCLLMPSARDLVMVFLALELVSVPGFVLVGVQKNDLRSNEGSLKFFLIGVLSVTVLLFGLSILYGFTGTTDLARMATALAELGNEPLVLGAMLFVIVGFGFKISAVPFHFWAPDSYEGAPIPVTTFLSVASKAAGFAGLLQVCFIAFAPLAEVWAPILGVIAIITMTFGNLVALQQRNIVRLLAYSSVATGGYLLVPFGLVRTGADEVNQAAFSSVMMYLLVYAVMNIGAFAVVIAVARRGRGRMVEDYAGLGQRNAGLAVALTAFLVALTGIPPTIGLWGKFFILNATVVEPTPLSITLAAAVVINSVIGAFYYLRVARVLWTVEPTDPTPVRPGFALGLSITALAVATIVLGVLPFAFANLAEVSTLVVASGS